MIDRNIEARHPFSRSFVVQFRDGSGPGAIGFVGRVEHLRTGQRVHFASPEELMKFLESILGAESQNGEER